jgi:hypothetical protein
MTEKMQFILSMTEEEILLAKRSYQLKKLISRAGEEGITQASAFNKCGHGITAEQFDSMAEGLAASGWCSRKNTKPGTWLLTINPVFKDINLP